MSPNSNFKLDSEANLTVSNNKMMNRDDSLVSATTDVAATEKQAITSPETKAPGEESFDEFLQVITRDVTPDAAPVDAPPEEADPEFEEFVKLTFSAKQAMEADAAAIAAATASSGDILDVPSPSSNNDSQQASRAGEPSSEWLEAASKATKSTKSGGAAGGGGKTTSTCVGEEYIEAMDMPSLQRRRSSDVREAMNSQNLLDSVATQDSWGGKVGSLPQPSALLGDMLSDLDADVSDPADPAGSSPPSPQDNAPKPEAGKAERAQSCPAGEIQGFEAKRSQSCPAGEIQDFEDVDNVANFVNFSKLLEPSSSEYYYSKANRDNRKKLEKYKSKLPLSRAASLDESHRTRDSILSHRTQSSAYRGPMPTKNDGSMVRGVMKKNGSSNSENCHSLGSLNDNSGPKAGGMRRCAFSSVDIREHERVVGDNPCVTSGVPLSIGWGYYQHDPINLDDYEVNKGPARDKIEMMVPAGIRRQMLRDEFGVSINDMNAAMKNVNVTKRQRRHTVATEHMEGWEEVMQSAKRKFKRILKRTSTEKEQQMVWELAQQNAKKKGNSERSLGGKNLDVVSVGSKGSRPKVVPENNAQGPVLEISFREGGV